MEIITITEKPVVLYLKSQFLGKPQHNSISPNVPNFLQINNTWYNLKNRPRTFLTKPAVLKIFKIQEKPAFRSFFIFQSISENTNVFKNHRHSFLSYTKY